MEKELPGVIDELLALGGLRRIAFTALPTELTGEHHEDDARFDTVTARRPVVEAAVATVAASTPGVTIRRGVAVTGTHNWAEGRFPGFRTSPEPGKRRGRRRRRRGARTRCGSRRRYP